MLIRGPSVMAPALFFFLFLVARGTFAQFTCTLTNTDESSCLNAKGDDNDHCVWCSIAGFGVCVSEAQAEQMENNLPNAQCDRYSGDDDTTPSNDDKTPSNDDDSVSPPSDDSLPDNFWECLQKQDSKSCTGADCTWCVSKQYHFGLCMTGPTAESAADSDFFDCTAPNHDEALETVKDPADTACLAAFLQNPTQEGCTSATDSEGNPCQWCDWNGSMHLCLTEEQAEITSEGDFGVTCSKEDTTTFALAHLRGRMTEMQGKNVEDPWDPSCLMAYLQDPTEEACEAATDSDGLPCLYCDLQGQTQLCLTEEQAQYGEQLGMTCSSENKVVVEANPYDPSCALAFLQDMTPDACLQAVDEDGQPCEYCTLQGSVNLCLTQEQAEVGEQLGIECEGEQEEENMESDPLDTSCLMAQLNAGGQMEPSDCTAATDNDGEACEFCSIPGVVEALCLTDTQAEIAQQAGGFVQCGDNGAEDIEDPQDPTCALAYFQDPTPDGCTSATDQDGNACEYCTFQGQINLCLNEEQAEIAEQFGIECGDSSNNNEEPVQDVLDTSCLMALVNAGGSLSPDDCTSTLDEDGNACEFCSIPGVADALCLTSEQAELATQFGGDRVQCGDADENLEFPPNMFKCLQEYQEHDCDTSDGGCTWCNSQVGMGFCVANPAADALSECDFFSCDTHKMASTIALEMQ